MSDEVIKPVSTKRRPAPGNPGQWGLGAFFLLMFALGVLYWAYDNVRIEVPADSVAVLIRKTGKDLKNGDEVAPDATYKGVQQKVLGPGRYLFKYDPFNWGWEVVKQIEIPDGKLGVRVRKHGEDLPYGQFLAVDENQKGIVPGVLMPGRYPINPYLELVEQREPQVVPAGFKGVVTNLSGPIPMKNDDYFREPGDGDFHKLLVKPGFRGVEKDTLDPGTYYFNPYEKRIDLVDCRNQRFNLGDSKDLGFPSKDGFWVSLDSIVEFRIQPEMAARVFVLYNESVNGDEVNDEIVRKIILPAARSFCRLQGSNNLGKDFIQGSSRSEFQQAYQAAMEMRCEPLGIDVVQALITKINPPQQIAGPVRDREIAVQKEKQYQQQMQQQKSEEKLGIEKEMVKQKQALVETEREVVKITTQAMREQEVALTKAKEQLAVAQLKLDAAKDEASAILSKGKAEAEIVTLKNEAEATGWRQAVKAFDGNGGEYAQYVLFQKLAQSYRSLMINTADSPIMKIFEQFETPASQGKSQRAKVKSDDEAPVTANP
jgi:regulator of protease activity HflC (stomatin/prohibitin superfamily)